MGSRLTECAFQAIKDTSLLSRHASRLAAESCLASPTGRGRSLLVNHPARTALCHLAFVCQRAGFLPTMWINIPQASELIMLGLSSSVPIFESPLAPWSPSGVRSEVLDQ